MCIIPLYIKNRQKSLKLRLVGGGGVIKLWKIIRMLNGLKDVFSVFLGRFCLLQNHNYTHHVTLNINFKCYNKHLMSCVKLYKQTSEWPEFTINRIEEICYFLNQNICNWLNPGREYLLLKCTLFNYTSILFVFITDNLTNTFFKFLILYKLFYFIFSSWN